MMQNRTVELQDIALDAFRNAFPVGLAHVIVSDDGMTMRMGHMLSDRLATEMWLTAQKIIQCHRLPLQAEVMEWKIEGVTFDRFLQIEFVGRLEMCN